MTWTRGVLGIVTLAAALLGAQVATGAGIRSGWIVMRGDPRDPELTAKDFPVELVVIDALTGQPLQRGARGLRP